jgi:hypothetical protein
MPSGWEWVILASVGLIGVAIAVVVVISLVVISNKRRALPAAPIPAQLQQADQLLATGQIDPPEHAAMRNRILGITD